MRVSSFLNSIKPFDSSPFFVYIALALDSLTKIGFNHQELSEINLNVSVCGLVVFFLFLAICLLKDSFLKTKERKKPKESSARNLFLRIPPKFRKEIQLFLLNFVIIGIYIEAQVSPLQEYNNIFEGVKMAFLQITFAKNFVHPSFQVISSLSAVFYVNFRLLTNKLLIQNCCFLALFLIVMFGFHLIALGKRGNNAMLSFKLQSSKTHIGKSDEEKAFDFPSISHKINRKIWKRTEASLALFDSSNFAIIYKTSLFEKAFPDLKNLLNTQVKVTKYKPQIPSLKTGELKTFSFLDNQNLLNLFSKLQTSFEESRFSIFARVEELPNLHSRYIDIFKFCEDNRAFILILVTGCRNNYEAIVQNQSRILSFVSHEFRTPLNCITGMLQCLEDLVQRNHYEQFIQPALSSGKYLLNMLQDILDMTQIKAGKFSLNIINFDICLLLEDIFSLFTVQSKTKKILMSYDINPLVPRILKSDPNRLKQIIVNLLSNAFKYTQKGEIILYCTTVNKNPQIIKISVKDTGLGIKDIDKPKLLKAFGRIEDHENKELNPQGIGLGLIISQDISKLLAEGLDQIPESEKGLHFETEYTKGSTFSFIFESHVQHDPVNHNEIDLSTIKEEHLSDPKTSGKRHTQNSKTITEREETEGPEDKIEHLKMQENVMKFLHNSKSNYQIVLNERSIPRSIYKKARINTEILPLMKSTEFIQPLKNISFGNIELDLTHNEKGVDQKWKMSIYNDLSISYSSSSKKSALELSKLQEIITKVERFQKTCLCPDVLVVDDDGYNIVALQFLLNSLNFKYQTASSGNEAIEKVIALSLAEVGENCCRYFKIILLDIEMPEKNGYETCLEIRNYLFKMTGNNDVTKIVACTGYSDEESHQKIKEAGFSNHLVKPVMKGALIAILADFGNPGSLKSIFSN